MKIFNFYFSCIGIVFIFNILKLINSYQNTLVLDIYDNVFNESEDVNNSYIFPILEVNNRDYIGLIILEDGFRLPIENKCSNSFLKIQSACRYVTNSLVIMGTNWKNSFYNYDSFELDDTIFISNSLGNKFRYHIIDIVKSNDLNQLLERNQDLIIIVRNYYAGEYTGYICVQC